MVFGGLAFHDQKTPPPLPNQAVYSTQWLSLVQQQGTVEPVPSALIIAAIAASSGGLSLDQTKAGGYGLFDLSAKADMGHPAASVTDFTHDLMVHWQSNNLQATLNAVGQTLVPPQSNWSATVRSDLQNLEQGPAVIAWPVTNNWSSGPLGLGGTHWNYPKTGRLNITAAASAPAGAPYVTAWTPPRQYCTLKKVNGADTEHCHTVTDNITGSDLIAPASMVVKTASGKTVPMKLETSTTPNAGALINPHDVLWVTTRPVLVNAQHPVKIVATWGEAIGTVTATLPGSGFAQGSGGATAVVPMGPVPSGNPQTVDQIWTTYQASLTAAAQQAHIPVAPLVSEAYWESGGIPYAYQNSQTACGMFQMFSPGAFTAYQPHEPPAACAVPSIEAVSAADYLSSLYSLFGSWRAAIAGYYGGQGTVLGAGVHPGMTWAQDAPLLNFIPDPQAGNTETMTVYAEQSFNTMQAFAKSHGMAPMP